MRLRKEVGAISKWRGVTIIVVNERFPAVTIYGAPSQEYLWTIGEADTPSQVAADTEEFGGKLCQPS